MENKGIWELIAKFASPQKQNGKNNNQPSNEKNLQNSPPPLAQTQNENPLSGSFAKSYNPFSALEKQKNQILGLKAQKPTKTIIELKNSKPISKNISKDKNYDIIELINNHNRYVSLLKKPTDKL